MSFKKNPIIEENQLKKDEMIEHFSSDKTDKETSSLVVDFLKGLRADRNFTLNIRFWFGINDRDFGLLFSFIYDFILENGEKKETNIGHTDVYDVPNPDQSGLGYIVTIGNGSVMSTNNIDEIIPDNGSDKHLNIYPYYPNMPVDKLNSVIDLDTFDFNNTDVYSYNDMFNIYSYRLSKEEILKKIEDKRYFGSGFSIHMYDVDTNFRKVSNIDIYSDVETFVRTFVSVDNNLNINLDELFLPVHYTHAFEFQNKKSVFDINFNIASFLDKALKNVTIMKGGTFDYRDLVTVKYGGLKGEYHLFFVDYDGSNTAYLYKDVNNIYTYFVGSNYKHHDTGLTLKEAIESVYFSYDYPFSNDNSLDNLMYEKFLKSQPFEEIIKYSSYAYKVEDGRFDFGKKSFNNFGFLEFISRALLESNI